ncbi:MAG: regulator of amino acid metabolism, contains ACT domain protein [Methanomicrobiales archaeon]|nr:regulator of amino acid metabolism, contains ACT domain protein [Methanomicrobiales archaeon]MDI6877211.1 regulator of amino acid metabolism, contains ACT domain protein [Methanomicrobiales archaeon]
MWADIMREFQDSPSQARVVRFLLENGFGISESGKIACNGVEIPATHIAKAIGADRRVVDATAQHILDRPFLKDIFLNIRATPDLSRVAEHLGLSVITVLPRNAQERGIVGAVVGVLSRHNLNLRQIFVTDPYFSEEPRLVVILDEPLPSGVLEELKSLPAVRKIIL